MNKRSAMIVAGALVAALLGGMAGATHEALTLKAAAGAARTVVVVRQPAANAAQPVLAAAPAEPLDSD
jgi:hypothetical protein